MRVLYPYHEKKNTDMLYNFLIHCLFGVLFIESNGM